MRLEVASLLALLVFIATTTDKGAKAFCRLGALPGAVTQAVAAILNVFDTTFHLLVDADGVRHALAQHGEAKRQAEEARGQVPIVEADLLHLAHWLTQPTAIYNGQAKPGK